MKNIIDRIDKYLNESKVEIKPQGKQWAIYVDGKLVEGGFFSKDSAESYADKEYKDVKESLTEAVYKVDDRWMGSIESAYIAITSPLTNKTLYLYKNHFGWQFVDKNDEDILANVIKKAQSRSKVEYSKEEMLVFMKYATMFDSPRKVVTKLGQGKTDPYSIFKQVGDSINKKQYTVWGNPHIDGSYSQEDSSLDGYNKCPKCGQDNIRRYLKAKHDDEGDITEWSGICPKCKTHLTIWND